MGTLFDILHIVAAVFIVGPMAIIPMTALRALRGGEAGQVRVLAKSTNLFSLLSLVVVVLGFGAMGLSDPKYHVTFTDTWIWLSVVLYLIALVLTLFVVVPTLRTAAEAIDGAASTAGAADAAGSSVAAGAKPSGYGKVAASSGIATLLLVFVVVLMVWKP
jgi:uncharacterized membrane protein